jgi:hypothetical protein
MNMSTVSATISTINSIKTIVTQQWDTGANIEVTFNACGNGTLFAYFSTPTVITWGTTAMPDATQALTTHTWAVHTWDFKATAPNLYSILFGIQINGVVPTIHLTFEPNTPTPTPAPAPTPTPTPKTLQLVYGNFMLPSNYTKSTLNQQLQSFYQKWKQQYLKTYQNGAYIQYAPSGTAVTVSEAQGYLMLMSVMMDDQTIFNQAVNFYQAFKDPSGLMSWRISNNSGKLYVSSGDNDSATDGDLDITLALFLAHYRWGSASINYLNVAQASAQALVHTCVNKTLYSLKLGDWATSDTSGLGLATRSSDFMLGHIKLFMLADTQNTALWKNVYNSIVALCFEFVPKYANNTGLICDFPVYQNNAWAQPSGQVLEKPEDRDYNWNACRLFMRLATDALDGFWSKSR